MQSGEAIFKGFSIKPLFYLSFAERLISSLHEFENAIFIVFEACHMHQTVTFLIKHGKHWDLRIVNYVCDQFVGISFFN